MDCNELNTLKEKLNELIMENEDGERIYEISKEIDKCIVEYYKRT